MRFTEINLFGVYVAPMSLMLVAAWTVHRHNGFFIVKEGWEYNLVLAVSAVAVATLGPGRFSLDWVIFGINDPLIGWNGDSRLVVAST